MENIGEVIALIKSLGKGGGGGGGTNDHKKLKNRNAKDQHPISAITGLQEALDKGGGITVKDAKVGQLIRAKAVDETGNITEYEPVPWGYIARNKGIVIAEQTVELADGMGRGIAEMAILPGDVCKVSWEDQTHELTAISFPNEGLTSALFIGSDMSTAPWIIGYGESEGQKFFILLEKSGATSVKLKVTKVAEEIQPIPSELIPKDNIVITKMPDAWTEEEWNSYEKAFNEGTNLSIKLDQRYNGVPYPYLGKILSIYVGGDTRGNQLLYTEIDRVTTFNSFGRYGEKYTTLYIGPTSDDILGGVKANRATSEDTQDVHIDENGFLKTSPGVRLEKLWENASPTAHFVAQTLKLDFSDAKFVIIINKVKDDTEVFNTSISINGKENRAFVIWGDANASRSNTITNNSIEFSTGSYLYTGSSHSSYAKGTGYCIPIEIYKVVL